MNIAATPSIFTTRNVSVGGKTLATQMGGQGTPIVLFHSL